MIGLISSLSKIEPLITFKKKKKKYIYLINIRSSKFLKKIFPFFLISLKRTMSLSLSLFARFSIPEQKHERQQAAGQIFSPPFSHRTMRNLPVTQSDRPTDHHRLLLPTRPYPWICTLFSGTTRVSPRNSSSTPHGYTVIFRLRIQNRGNSKGTVARPARVWRTRSLSRNVDIRCVSRVMAGQRRVLVSCHSLVLVTRVFSLCPRIFVSGLDE